MNRRQLLGGIGGVAAVGCASKTWASGGVKVDDASVLIVVDVQNCFLPGGSLAVKNGDQVVPVINQLAKTFRNVVMTQDWHTPDHVSFASTHAGKQPFDIIELDY